MSPISDNPGSSASSRRDGARNSVGRQRILLQAIVAVLFVAMYVYAQREQAREQAREEAQAAAEQEAASVRKTTAAKKTVPSTTSTRSTPDGKPPHGTNPAITSAEPKAPTARKPTPPRPPLPPQEKPVAKSDPTTARGPPKDEQAEPTTRFRNVTLRNQDGKVVYRGDIDVTSTLARIDRGETFSRYRNDGITFQNREGRLPKQPSGHYREWVHPTPGVSGPGPQRIVTGKGGEAFYTHDHYDTFRRIR